jgi:drug/metabolite transporter (DMT)-like permease
MLEFTAFLAAIGPVAILITKAVDFVRSFDSGDTWPKGLWIALALVGGVVYAVATGANWVSLIQGLDPGVQSTLSGTVGKIATGLAVGAMACFWHEPLSGWGNKAGPTPPATP